MSENLCACGCSQPAGLRPQRGMRRSCYSRWLKLGKPGLPLPPALTTAQRLALARAAKDAKARLKAAEDAPYEPDEDDLAWARELWARRRDEPENRAKRARPLAAALIRCVGSDDAAGIDLLLSKVRDWKALTVILAECADPARTAIVTCQPLGPLLAAARRAPLALGAGSPESSQSATVALTAPEGDASAAA